MPIERRYWDSACFIAVLGNEAGRVEVCEPVLRAASVHAIEIVTSAFTITEVLYPRGGRPLPPHLRATVKKFFRHPGIVLVNVDRRIAESAQEYFWDFNVRPKDAVHVACAIAAKVPVLETYDADLICLSGQIGGNPSLIIREPEHWPVPQPAQPAQVQGDLLRTED